MLSLQQDVQYILNALSPFDKQVILSLQTTDSDQGMTHVSVILFNNSATRIS